MSEPQASQPTTDALLREALDEWQQRAGNYSDMLIARGHHSYSRHESPEEYDDLSRFACDFPGCLTPATPPASAERDAVVEAAKAYMATLQLGVCPICNGTGLPYGDRIGAVNLWQAVDALRAAEARDEH